MPDAARSQHDDIECFEPVRSTSRGSSNGSSDGSSSSSSGDSTDQQLGQKRPRAVVGIGKVHEDVEQERRGDDPVDIASVEEPAAVVASDEGAVVGSHGEVSERGKEADETDEQGGGGQEGVKGFAAVGAQAPVHRTITAAVGDVVQVEPAAKEDPRKKEEDREADPQNDVSRMVQAVVAGVDGVRRLLKLEQEKQARQLLELHVGSPCVHCASLLIVLAAADGKEIERGDVCSAQNAAGACGVICYDTGNGPSAGEVQRKDAGGSTTERANFSRRWG